MTRSRRSSALMYGSTSSLLIDGDGEGAASFGVNSAAVGSRSVISFRKRQTEDAAQIPAQMRHDAAR